MSPATTAFRPQLQGRVIARSRWRARPMATLATFGVVASAAAALGGCGSEYDPPSLINKLRVIAVRAEPPVLRVDAPTTLTPLVVGVDEPLCFAWAFCPFAWPRDGAFECFDPRLQQAAGDGETATITPAHVFQSLAAAPAVFEELGLKLPEQVNNPQQAAQDGASLETYVLFKVATRASLGGACPSDPQVWLDQRCGDRDTCLQGYKRLVLATKPEQVHTNPVLSRLEVNSVAWPEGLTPTVAPYAGDPDDAFFGLAGGALPLTPVWDPASRDKVPAGQGVAAKDESLLFSWFSTGGDFEKQRSYDEVPANAFLPPTSAAKPVRIWVVVRDGRNGVDWASREVVVQAGAPKGNPLCAAAGQLTGCP